jgi:Ca2+-binding RTX toxin-like protein
MGFPNVPTKAPPVRACAAFIACVACLLAIAASAHAAEQTVSYTDPAGHSSATRGGTSQYRDIGPQQEAITVSLWSTEGKRENYSGLICDSSGEEEEQCDDYDVFGNGSVEAKSPCVKGGLGVLCPDAEYFVASLGTSSNDSYVLDSPLQYQSATVNAGNGGDYIEGTNPPEYEGEFPDRDLFTGGTGNDLLIGGPGNDVLRGGPGNDTLDGRGGNDELLGEGGNDSIYGGANGSSLEAGGEGVNTLGWEFNLSTPDAGHYDGGNETFDGAEGISTVSFEGAPGPVTAKVDGLPDSGVAGQKDTIEPNVTEVNGSENGDTLIAGTTPVTLDGEGGNDLIEGGPGGDTLRGGAGDNTIKTDGPDGAGPDSIYAAESFCNLEVSCPGGNSVIYADDGIRDQITCGPGADIVYADALDVVSTTGVFACPTVYRSAGAGNPGGGAGNPGGVANPGGAANAGASAGTSSFAHVKTNGDVASLTFACAGAATATCADSLALSALETLRSGKVVAVAAKTKTKKRTLTLGQVSASLAGGTSKTLSVSLDSTGRVLLAQYRSLHVKLVATETIGGKQVVVKTLTLTFTAPKRHR